MKTTSFRARTLACALLASTAYCGLTAAPAAAQSPTPSARLAPDANGVDVITGELSVPLRSVSVGRPGESGLTYVNGYSDGVRQDSFVLELDVGATEAQVNIHGRVVTFRTNSSGVFVPDDADGSTLVPSGSNFIYTARDGTWIQFLSAYSTGFDVTARGSSVRRPNGEELTYHYKMALCDPGQPCLGSGVRVQSVTSNLGYQLKAYYGSNSFDVDPAAWSQLTRVVAINQAVDYCTPTADTCPAFTKTWPELALTRSESGANATDTIADNLSNTMTVISTNDEPTSITSPANPAVDMSLTYDVNGRVASLTRGGGTWGYSYADSGSQRTTTVTQPLGGSRVYVSDLTLKRVLSQTDELGRTTSNQYDSSGRLTRTTAPEGNYTQLTYDARGNVTETRAVAKSGSGLADIVATASFASTCSNAKTCNQPASVTDARGNVTDFTYDATHGGVLTITAPAPTSGAVRPQTRMSYSPLSAYYKNYQGTIVAAPTPVYKLTATSACQTQSSCTGAADEVKTAIAYGSAGVANNLLPTSVTSGSGNNSLTATSAMTYDPVGNLLTVDGPLSGTADTVRYRYDAARRPVGTVSPDPDGAGALKHRARKVTFDADGNATKVESGTVNSQSDSDWAAFAAVEAVETGYDTLGRPVTSKLTSGGTTYSLTQTSYDAKGRAECTAQRMNPGAFGSLPSSACSLGTPGSHGPDRISKTIYDNANQVTQVKTALGTLEEANEVTATYRDNGQAETVTDAENNKTSYVYDGHGRLSQTQYPSQTKGAGISNSSDYEQLGYDQGSNVTSFRNRANETTAFTFDALNRMTLKNLPGTEPDVTYSYDLLGRMTGASDPSQSLSMSYDALGRNLTQVGPHGTVSSAWDIGGRRTKLTYPDGFVVDYTYLVTGEMKTIQQPSTLFGMPTVLITFNYDTLGRRTSLSRLNGATTSYSYDPVSRLSQLVQDAAGTANDLTLGFSYNPASQIISNTRSNDVYAWSGHGNGTSSSPANGLNQLTSHNGGSVSHDAKGNILNDPTIGYTYGYSSENLLTTASGGPWIGTLRYDPLMRLYESGVSGKSRFVYDGHTRIAEYYSSGAQTYRFVHGPGVDEPLIEYSGSGLGTRTFLHADERGSIIAGSDNNGNVTGFGRYDEYGKPASTNFSRFGLAGQPYETLSELYDSRARMYNPRLPRFMQPDPIGFGDGMNMYNRTKGDPVNFVDPLGLQECRTVNSGYFEYYDRNNNNKYDAGDEAIPGSEVNSPYEFCTGFDQFNGGPRDIVVTGRRKPRERITTAPALGPWENGGAPSLIPAAVGQQQDWCGGQDAISSKLPEGAWSQACRKHDSCYGQSGSTRLQCDVRFFRDVLVECSRRTAGSAGCSAVAIAAFTIVRAGGAFFYKPSPGSPVWFRY
jgi:RHS repeat-associated protein